MYSSLVHGTIRLPAAVRGRYFNYPCTSAFRRRVSATAVAEKARNRRTIASTSHSQELGSEREVDRLEERTVARPNSYSQGTEGPSASEEALWSRSLCVSGLPRNISVEVVRRHFQEIAEVWDVRRWTYSSTGDINPTAMALDFPSPHDAQRVLDAHQKKPFDLGAGRLAISYISTRFRVTVTDPKLKLSFRRSAPPNRFVYVHNLSKWTTREDVRNYFQSWGEIKDVHTVYKADETSRPVYSLEFESIDDAMALVEEHRRHPIIFRSNTLCIEFCKSLPEKPLPPNRTLRVGGFTGDESTLRGYFREYERYIKKVSLMLLAKDDMGRDLVLGFVDFYTTEQAQLAKERLSKEEFEDGVRLQITFAQMPKPEARLAGHFGEDHGGKKYKFGLKKGRYAESTARRDPSERGRFKYKNVDWEEALPIRTISQL